MEEKFDTIELIRTQSKFFDFLGSFVLCCDRFRAGDSHAERWKPLLDGLDKRNKSIFPDKLRSPSFSNDVWLQSWAREQQTVTLNDYTKDTLRSVNAPKMGVRERF